jgi:hypothetical protein
MKTWYDGSLVPITPIVPAVKPPLPVEAPSPPVLKISETVPRPVARVDTRNLLERLQEWVAPNTRTDSIVIKTMTIKQLMRHLELNLMREEIEKDIRKNTPMVSEIATHRSPYGPPP